MSEKEKQLRVNNYYLCDLKSISPYQKLNFNVTISVLNNQATQQKYQVVILEPFLSYIDSNNQENIIYDQVKANCEAAPVLRVVLNPDPSSTYSLPGTGFYIDNAQSKIMPDMGGYNNCGE